MTNPGFKVEKATAKAGQALWQRAKAVIPGGNSLLSKRPEMFVPGEWPTYFSKARGCEIWDLDGRHFVDTSLMGVGTNLLGYGNHCVDSAVLNAVSQGNMSTLNCPEEVALAERLVELNPWAQMVRFARTGGEANAIAVRVARAASGRDGVAFCGYHGWHDWYLAANLGNKDGLEGHLLPGLEPLGVPRNLRDTSFTFEYNNLSELEAIVDSKNPGVIVMEVSRGTKPKDGFLQSVREIATKNGIVLVFDECTSGFRETFGGLHAKYGVEPDLAMYGKALGNGYAITAVVGRSEVMETAQSSFISSTFWTERIGPVAALATLGEMERLRTWEMVSSMGRSIKSRWRELASDSGIQISVTGLDALPAFIFENTARHQEFRTFISHEMLRKGFLAANAVFVSTAHTEEIVNRYFDAISGVFSSLSELERNGDPAPVPGEYAHSGFRRLN